MSWKDTKSDLFEALPTGNYPLVLESFDIGTTKPEKGSKLMYTANLKIEDNDEPSLQPYIGRVVKDWFCVGVDGDPGAEDEETLNSGTNKGVAKIKRLSEAAEIEPDNPDSDINIDLLEEVLNGAIGVSVVGRINKKGPKGAEQHNINGYFKVGERQLGLDQPNAQQGKGNKPNQKQGPTPSIHQMKQSAVKPKTKVLEIVEDEDDETPVQPKKQAQKVAGKVEKPIPCVLDCGAKVLPSAMAKHLKNCNGPEHGEDGGIPADDDE